MNIGVDPQACGHSVEARWIDRADIGKGDRDPDHLARYHRIPAGAVDPQGQAGPCGGQVLRDAFGDVDHLQRTRATGIVRSQNHPMTVPQITVIGPIAIAVLIIKRRVVEIGVRGGSGENDSRAAV